MQITGSFVFKSRNLSNPEKGFYSKGNGCVALEAQGCIYGCQDRNQSEVNQKHSEPEISKFLQHIQPYPNLSFEFFRYLGWYIQMMKVRLHKPLDTGYLVEVETFLLLFRLWPYFAKLHFKKVLSFVGQHYVQTLE